MRLDHRPATQPGGAQAPRQLPAPMAAWITVALVGSSSLVDASGVGAQEPCTPRAKAGALALVVVDRETEDPVAGASLRLVPLDCTGVTDEDGRYRFARVPPGEFTLEIRHLGYGERSVDVDVPRERTVVLDVRLPPQAIEVEPLAVEVERTLRIPFLERNDFYWRMERGWGHFFPPEYFAKHHVISAGQVLHRIPGIRIQGGSLHRGSIELRNIVACEGWDGGPLLYIDGRAVERVSSVQKIHEWVSPASIGAMEVYRRPSETAPEFVSAQSACGVIVIWTKRWMDVEVAGH